MPEACCAVIYGLCHCLYNGNKKSVFFFERVDALMDTGRDVVWVGGTSTEVEGAQRRSLPGGLSLLPL